MKEQFADAQAPITAIYYCPHHPTKALGSYRMDCTCRKPAPGMLLKAQADYDIDMSQSLMIGDKSSDMAAALAAQVNTRILVGKDGRETPQPCPECTMTAKNLLEAVNLFLDRTTL